MEDFDAWGPEIRIPGRDLAFERGQVWEGVQIWDKNDRDFEIGLFPKISGQIRFENRDFGEITPAIWISRRDLHIPNQDFSKKHPGPKKSGTPKTSRFANKKVVLDVAMSNFAQSLQIYNTSLP